MVVVVVLVVDFEGEGGKLGRRGLLGEGILLGVKREKRSQFTHEQRRI